MFDSKIFSVIFTLILLIHLQFINNINKNFGNSDIKDKKYNSIIQWRDNELSPISEQVYASLENNSITIYNNQYYSKATSKKVINIHDNTGNKVKINSNIYLNKVDKIKYKDLYYLSLTRTNGNEKVFSQLFFDNNEDKQNWITQITDTKYDKYGTQSDGSVVLTDAQLRIKKYIEKSKEYKKIIDDPTTPQSTYEDAVANLMELRDNLDKELKKYGNSQNIDSILKNDNSSNDVKMCDCNNNNLSILVYYINVIIIGFTFFYLSFIFINLGSTNSYIYDTIEFLKSILFGFFIVFAIMYHGYLLTYCRCALKYDEYKSYSYLFMLLFIILLSIQIGVKM
jgi:hypothetical protein